LIDIHCHLLPDIDDGPDSWEESLELARLLLNEGVETAITTPHWIKGSNWEPESAHVLRLVDELNLKLAEEKVSLNVLPGMEIGINENLVELTKNGKILTLGGGNHILVETPYVSIPYGIKEIIFRLKVSGLEPILAHPEKCGEIQSNPKGLQDIVNSCALIQITTSSLLGYFGRRAKECAIILAKEGLVHFVASDAHSPDERPPLINNAIALLKNLIGEENTRAIEQRGLQVISLP
jgi:protein-tyrosine phosphatase